ncbi:MAG: GGDEF domain-containing protein [Clostridiales bacterium]|nr:GGDEF domain-containing protein [Clostridiales bacterium]
MNSQYYISQLNEAESIIWKSPKECSVISKNVKKNISNETEPYLYLKSYFLLSRALWLLGDFSQALLEANHLMKNAKLIKSDEFIGKAHNIIGNIYLYMDNDDVALENYLSGLEYSTKSSDFDTLSSLMNNIGEIYNKLENYDKSKYYYEESIRISEENNNLRNVGVGSLNLAEIAFKEKDIKTASTILKKALKIHYETSDHIGIAYAVALQADILQYNREYEEAILALKRAKEVLSETEDKYNLILVNKKLIDLYFTVDKLDNVKTLINESLELAKGTNSSQWIFTFSLLLSDYYEKINAIEKAFESYKYGCNFKMKSYTETIEQKNVEIQFKMSEAEHENELILQYNEILREKNNELNLLYQNIHNISTIGKKITSILESSEIYLETYEYLKKLTSVDFFGISFYNKKTNEIVPEFFINKGVIEEFKVINASPKNSLSSFTILNNKSLLTDNIQNEYHDYKSYKNDSTTHSIIYVPIVHHDEVLGAMTIQSDQIGAYSENELNLLEELSSYFAIAISNAKISEKLQQEIDERKKAQDLLENLNKQLLSISRIDSLTNIPNRRRLQEYLEDIININSRSNTQLAVLIVDVDHFKEYNDNYGHVKGDDVLRQVTDILKNSIHRESDFISRYGGDEFVIILPDTSLSGCRLVSENLLQNIRNSNIEHLHSPVKPYLTITIGGYCEIPNQDTSMDTMLQNADKSLYEAKTKGRNSVIIHQSEH